MLPGPLRDAAAGRWISYVLTIALITAGDLDTADGICAAGLARSRDAGDVSNQHGLLPYMVTLDLHAGRVQDAARHLHEELQLAVRTGSSLALTGCLDSCGHLCAATGRPAEAVTMWAAFTTLLGSGGGGDAPADARRRDEPQRAARQALGAGRTRAAEEHGSAMNLATATEYALMLTAPESPPPLAPPRSSKLSARKRELVITVAQGRTNAQIAAQLYISVRTVGSHLDRIRDKTGCRGQHARDDRGQDRGQPAQPCAGLPGDRPGAGSVMRKLCGHDGGPVCSGSGRLWRRVLIGLPRHST